MEKIAQIHGPEKTMQDGRNSRKQLRNQNRTAREKSLVFFIQKNNENKTKSIDKYAQCAV